MIDRFARVVADRLGSMLERGAGGGRGGPRGPSKLRGRKLEMRCRYPGCTNRSKGPRFRFLCETHRRLPKKKQDEALKKWAAKNA